MVAGLHTKILDITFDGIAPGLPVAIAPEMDAGLRERRLTDTLWSRRGIWVGNASSLWGRAVPWCVRQSLSDPEGRGEMLYEDLDADAHEHEAAENRNAVA